MNTPLLVVVGIIFVEVLVILSRSNPVGFKKRTWWELVPTGSNAQPDLAPEALALPRARHWRRKLTVVRLKQGQHCQVWVSFSRDTSSDRHLQALESITGCTANKCGPLPIQIVKRGWRVSHLRKMDDSTANSRSRYSWKDADVRAQATNSLLDDGDIVIMTIGWKTSGQIQARLATTSRELANSWVYGVPTRALIPWPSPVAAVPAIVIAACFLIVLDNYYELLSPFDSIVSYYSASPTDLTAYLAMFAIVHSIWRFVQELLHPRMIRRASRCWHLPLGWWVRLRGGTVSVTQLSGWARALR